MYFADIASSLQIVFEFCAGWGARSIMAENAADGNAENLGRALFSVKTAHYQKFVFLRGTSASS
jgi:hypothetical protein